MYALTNCQIYTGYETLENFAVIVDGDRIKQLVPDVELSGSIQRIDLQGAMLMPGFIDLQLNGCGGVQFNDDLDALSVKTLEIMQQTNLASGCTSFLPTLITSTDEFIFKAVKVMREYLLKYKNQALGLHIEGPFINVEKKGIHNPQIIRPLEQYMVDFLCDNADVIKILTIAPEKVEPKYIKQLSDAGINVSVGHSNGTYEQTVIGFRHGIRLATHLFNAMPAIAGRTPNVVGAIYDHPEVYTGIIADGEHVHWANIRNSHQIKRDKLVLVTDAILPTGTNIAEFTFSGTKIYYKNGRCTDENGTLAGAAITMLQSVENCIKYAGIPTAEAIRMATLYPAKAIGVANELGSIVEGKVANFAVVDKDWKLVKTILNGQI
ncbi:N-acetylglucosamine-6-phosphate deacetylase [Orbaceae bacterium ac157xtp]